MHFIYIALSIWLKKFALPAEHYNKYIVILLYILPKSISFTKYYNKYILSVAYISTYNTVLYVFLNTIEKSLFHQLNIITTSRYICYILCVHFIIWKIVTSTNVGGANVANLHFPKGKKDKMEDHNVHLLQ